MSEARSTTRQTISAANTKHATGGWRLYACVLGVTVALELLIFAWNGIYPFGDRVLQYSDGDQYFAFLGYLQSTFYSENDLLYSWSSVLGGNMLGTLAYYCASPFNLLIVLFPDNLMLGYHFIFCVKLIAAALSFAVMLRGMFGEVQVRIIVLFAASYPWIGYSMYFAWNQSWLDGVIFLPLIALGIWQILKQSRPVLYTLTLGITLLSNYYIGYMVGAASLLLFIAGLILLWKTARAAAKAAAYYCIGTCVAVALAAVILLPALHDLPEGRAIPPSQLLEGLSFRAQPSEILSMLYTAPLQNMLYWNNYPVIFTGIVQYVLVIMLLLNQNVAAKTRVVASALLMCFALSFMFSALDFAWHGFSVNVWYNHRYSFVASFVIELLAFYSFVHMAGASDKLLAAGTIVAGVTIVAMQASMQNLHPRLLLQDAVSIGALLVLLHFDLAARRNGQHTQQVICFVLIAVLTLGNVVSNALSSLDVSRDPAEARHVLGYLRDYENAMQTEADIEQLTGKDESSRLASTWTYTRADPMLFGYPGVVSYASTENRDALEAAGRLGLGQITLMTMYDDNAPISAEALIGLRYTASSTAQKAAHLMELGHADSAQGDLLITENPYALPIVVLGETAFVGSAAALNEPEYINACWNALAATGGEVLERIPDNRDITQNGNGSEIHIRFRPEQSGPIYAYVPQGDRAIEVPIPTEGQDIFCLGDFEAGQNGDLVIRPGDEYAETDAIAIYAERVDVLEEKAAAILSVEANLEFQSSSRFQLQYNTDRDRFAASTIPFAEGWHVYMDGRQIEPYRSMDAFLGFEAPAGEHTVELVYVPPYFVVGAVISIAALAVILWYVLRARRLATSSRRTASSPKTVIAHGLQKKEKSHSK